MKPYKLVLLIATPALASNQTTVQLLDNDVSVTVAAPNYENSSNESNVWEILNNKGWRAAKEVSESQTISAKLENELTYRENLSKLTWAIKTNNSVVASTLINNNPEWISCERIQWAWLDLQYEASSGYGPKLRKKILTLLNMCPKYAFSTTQKALAWSSSYHDSDVLSLYRQSSGYSSRNYDKLAYQVNLALLAERTLEPEQLPSIIAHADKKKDPVGAELIGWHYLDKQKPETALLWFDKTLSWSSAATEKHIEGKILSLNQLKKSVEAKQLLSQWEEKFPNLSKISLQSQPNHNFEKVCRNDPKGCLSLLNQQSEWTPQQHALAGWQWYKLDRPLTAIRSFERSLEHMTRTHSDYSTTRYGYSLALNKAGFEHKAQLIAKDLPNPTQQSQFAKQKQINTILNAYQNQDYVYVIEKSHQFETSYGKDVGLSEIKGWAYFNQKQPTKAVEIFRELAEAYPHDDTYRKALKTAECAQKKSYKLCW